MSLVLDGEHAVGPFPFALLPQKILMWGPTVGVNFAPLFLFHRRRSLASGSMTTKVVLPGPLVQFRGKQLGIEPVHGNP